MTRMMVMTFLGTERFRELHSDHHETAEAVEFPDAAQHSDHSVHEPHESPWLMTVPLIILGILSTVGGLIGVPYALSSMFGGHPEKLHRANFRTSHCKSARECNAPEHVDETVWLSPRPQAVDGAPAFMSLDEHDGVEASHSPEEFEKNVCWRCCRW